MSTFKESLVLVAVALEEEEVWDFASLNFRSELTKMNLFMLHGDYRIHLEFQLKVLEPNDQACSPPLGWISLYDECF